MTHSDQPEEARSTNTEEEEAFRVVRNMNKQNVMGGGERGDREERGRKKKITISRLEKLDF